MALDVESSVIAFNVLCSFGLGLSVFFILIAYFSKKVSRLPTWYMVMAMGAGYPLSMLLLVGYQLQNEQPAYEWCLAQASLVYAFPVGLTLAGAMFAVQLHLTLKFFILDEKTRLHRNNMLLLFIPCIGVCTMVVLVAVLGILHPEEATRSESQMYCRLEDDIAARTAGVLCGLAGFALLVTQGFTIRLLWPRWRSKAATNVEATSGGLVSRATIFRLLVLDVMALSAVAIGVVKGTVRFSSSIMNLYIAVLTLVGITTFGVSTLPFRRSNTATPAPSIVTDVESSFDNGHIHPEVKSIPVYPGSSISVAFPSTPFATQSRGTSPVSASSSTLAFPPPRSASLTPTTSHV